MNELTHTLPPVLALVNLGIAVGYAAQGHWWAVLYWTGAATVTFAAWGMSG